MKYYKGSIIFTIITLMLGYAYGVYIHNSLLMALSVLMQLIVLSVLEVSLSFDNAIANAKVLETMTEVWKRRFLTWGMIIAVFGMRVFFPIVIVAIVTGLGLVDAFLLAVNDPKKYSEVLSSSHIVIAGFGGAFLFLVAFEYFFNAEKDIHWVHAIEEKLSKLGQRQSVSVALVLAITYIISTYLPVDKINEFFFSAVAGIIVHEIVKLGSELMKSAEDDSESTATVTVAKNGFASFMYLEVLDASFSFDGVIGAFVITTNIFIIAGGLGIGAMFVRSMTIHLVEAKTLSEYRYLEHGAFYSIAILASIMYVSTMIHIPEVVTGLLSVSLIVIALWSSVKYNRLNHE